MLIKRCAFICVVYSDYYECSVYSVPCPYNVAISRYWEEIAQTTTIQINLLLCTVESLRISSHGIWIRISTENLTRRDSNAIIYCQKDAFIAGTFVCMLQWSIQVFNRMKKSSIYGYLCTDRVIIKSSLETCAHFLVNFLFVCLVYGLFLFCFDLFRNLCIC